MSVALSFHGDRQAEDHVQQTADDVRRARIAIAAYRLLDPRERSDLYERVQLCYPIDRDDAEPQATNPCKLVDQMPKVAAKVRRQAIKTVKLMDQPLIDQAIEGNSPTDEEPGAKSVDDPMNSSNESSSELSIEERRGIVRLMRESEESTLRGLSPLGWIRSRLGI